MDGPAARRLWMQRLIVCTSLAVPAALAGAADRSPARPTPTGPVKAADSAADPAQKLLLSATGRFNAGMYRPAAGYYETFLKQYPDHANATAARYAMGLCYYRLGEFAASVDPLLRVVADDKFAQRDEALAVLGHAQLSANKPADAIATFDRLIRDFPQSSFLEGSAINRVQALYGNRQYPAAAESARAFSERYPQSAQRPAALYFQALAYADEKSIAQAAAAAKTLIQSYPASPLTLDARLLLGQLHQQQGQVEQGLAVLNDAVASAPAERQAEVLYRLGVAYYGAGQFAEAAKRFDQSLAKDDRGPLAAGARLQSGLSLLADSKWDAARRRLSEALTHDKGESLPQARFGLAQCDLAQERYAEALKTLDDLAGATPKVVDAGDLAMQRGICLSRLGRHDEAARAFSPLAADPSKDARSAEAAYRQAFSLHQLKQFEASQRLTEKLQAGDSKLAASFRSANAVLNAENLFQLKRWTDARSCFASLSAAASTASDRCRYALRGAECSFELKDYTAIDDSLTPFFPASQDVEPTLARRATLLLGEARLQRGTLAASSAAFERYLALAPATDPNLGEVRYKLAVGLLRSSPPPDAERIAKLLDLVASDQSAGEWAWRAKLEQGRQAFAAEKFDTAQTLLDAVASDQAAPADVRLSADYLRGWSAFRAKQFVAAAGYWSAVADRGGNVAGVDPQAVADAALQRGVALKSAGQFDKAVDAFDRYISAYPARPETATAQRLAGNCLLSLDQPAKAVQRLQPLADSEKTVSEAVLYDLAWAQKKSGENDAALATYRRLTSSFTDGALHWPALVEWAELLSERGRYAEARPLLEQVVAQAEQSKSPIDPNVARNARYRLALTYDRLGESARAAEAFTNYAKAFPDDPQAAAALLQAGAAEASAGHFEKAVAILTEMIKRYPADPQVSLAQIKLGEAQADAGDFPAAQATHQAFLKERPKDPLAIRAAFGSGWAMENQKQFADARKAYEQATTLGNGPTAARAQFQIGETYLAENQWEQGALALLVVEDVYGYPEWSARALYDAGRAFEQLHRLREARQQYQTLVTKYPQRKDEAKLAGDRLKELGETQK